MTWKKNFFAAGFNFQLRADIIVLVQFVEFRQWWKTMLFGYASIFLNINFIIGTTNSNSLVAGLSAASKKWTAALQRASSIPAIIVGEIPKLVVTPEPPMGAGEDGSMMDNGGRCIALAASSLLPRWKNSIFCFVGYLDGCFFIASTNVFLEELVEVWEMKMYVSKNMYS